MPFRHHHPQRIAAAKAGFSERTARRIETNRRTPAGRQSSARCVPDPFAGLWDAAIRPMLEAQPALRPITLLEEMLRAGDEPGPLRSAL
jgi:hypothetical protein